MNGMHKIEKDYQCPHNPGALPSQDGDCGASELSTLAMSSPGVAQLSTPSEADSYANAPTALLNAGIAGLGSLLDASQAAFSRAAASTATASSAPGTNSPENRRQKNEDNHPGGEIIWHAFGGESALSAAAPANLRTAKILGNLKNLLIAREEWAKEDESSKGEWRRTKSPSRPAGGFGVSDSPTKCNYAEAAVEALAQAKRAEASRLVVERLAEQRSCAARVADSLQIEDLDAERLVAEKLVGDRMSAERRAQTTENERLLAGRLQRLEAREGIMGQQLAAEQSRVNMLRADLELARRELENRDHGNKLAEELKAREVHIAAKTQCLESMHEDAQREIETLKLQHHVVEVENGRSRSELAATAIRQKVLEEELRLLKERPPKAPKPATQRRAAGGKLLDRHDLASRTAFATKAASSNAGEDHPAVAEKAQEESSWFFGCCSASKASPASTVNAKAPERPNKPA